MRAPTPLPRIDSGQAMVEAAITLPLVVFLFLGTLQLFLMLQARIESEYAVFRAARAGSVTQGKCERMRHSAIAALLPTFTRTTTAQELANAFRLRAGNKFNAQRDSRHNRDIVWIQSRLDPPGLQARTNGPNADDARWDDPDRPLQRIDVRMIFWYPLRIPFANWVMSNMFLAHFRIRTWVYGDPTMVYKESGADWNQGQRGFMEAQVANEFLRRVNLRQYTFPIQSTYSMRMMTPPRLEYFNGNDPWCLR